jgi:hypothetical protein
VISDRHNADKLKQVCCEYIRQHYSQVIQTSQYLEIRSEVENVLDSDYDNNDGKNKNVDGKREKNVSAQNNPTLLVTATNNNEDKRNLDESSSQPLKKQRKSYAEE